jgi:hypothetical protein
MQQSFIYICNRIAFSQMKVKLLFVLFTLFSMSVTFGQRSLSGVVRDSLTGFAIQDAQVMLLESDQVAYTTSKGEFTFLSIHEDHCIGLSIQIDSDRFKRFGDSN